MKKLVFYSFIAISLLASCKKPAQDAAVPVTLPSPQPAPPPAIDTATIADGCISRIYFQPSQLLIAATDNATVQQLFQQNSMSVNNLQFYRYIYDPCPVCVTPGPYQYIRANQFFNGQLLFTGDVSFNFRQGVNYFNSGPKFSSVALDTISISKLQVLRKLFLSYVLRGQFGANYKDSCITAQFGYYDLNGGSAVPPGNFVKAWKVIFKNKDYPVAYLRDDQLNTLIYYDNGIRTVVGF